MDTHESGVDRLFIDKKSLKPYYSIEEQLKHISTRQLKNKLKKNR